MTPSEGTAGSSATGHQRTAFRGAILHFLDDPGSSLEASSYEYLEDGLLRVENGRVVDTGPVRPLEDDWQIVDYQGRLIMPGFIDTHIHYPQADMIAAHGEQLLEWLERYTFPVERRFVDADHAREVAGFFLDELLRNGTTTALVLGTVHTASVDSFFEVCAARRLRMVAGKVLMDRNAPADLTEQAGFGDAESRSLIERWHGRDRLGYAITPRFAPTSSDRQLELAGRLAAEYPDTWIHTHLAENHAEVAWVKSLFPERRSYLDVYDHYGLLRERAVFAHCLHLDAQDRSRMAASGAVMSFCPSSNLFLGSGLFDLAAADAAGVQVALATDVGAGTSFSLLQTLGDAYKVLQLNGQSLSSLRAFYLATLGGARALGLDQHIGSFAPAREADFVVVDPACTPLIERRLRSCNDLSERLFALMMLGDDRCIQATYILGQLAHERGSRGDAG